MADISKIKIPDGTSLNIKDATARQAIENLPKPMVFKGSLGTGGTITSLPTASSSNTGYVYKVIKAGTYASQSAKIGDTFVSDGSSWVLIPSGDEPSGTVTSIKISATSPINIDNSTAITTSGTRTISHASSGVSSGTYKSVTVNSTGHVTAGTNPTTIDGYGITDSAGRIVTGKEYTIDGETVTAGTGAEVFNRYNGTYQSIATGEYSHAEGQSTRALADYSHAEGNTTVATGASSHAEGGGSRANGSGSHAEGLWTIASGNYQHVQGKFNIEDLNNTYSFIIGNGSNTGNRSNAFAIDWNGKIYTNNASTGIDVNKLAEKVVDEGAKNLLKITGTSQTINGVTFTVNDDGTVTVNGTNTGTGSAAFIFIPNRQAILIPDGNYILSGCPQGGGNDTFDLRWFRYSPNASAYDTGSGAVVHKSGNTTDSNIAIVVKSGATVDNVIFKPMICTTEDYAISSEYVPYAKSNYQLTRDVRPIPKLVDDGAKNLLKNTAPYGDLVRTNLTFTHNDDDTYVVNAASANTANTDLYVASDIPIKAGTYILTGCPKGGNNSNTYKLQIAGIGYDLGDGHTFKISQDTTINVYIRIWNGYVPNNLVFKPMICTVDEYAISSEYISYAESNYQLTKNKTSKEDVFGSGILIPNNTDWDTLTDIGNYYVASAANMATMTNSPTNNVGGRLEVTTANAVAHRIQRFYTASTVNQRLYIRMLVLQSGVLAWTDWCVYYGTFASDDTWITLKSGSGTGISASDVKYRLNGKTMCITGYVKPSSTAASITIGTLAEKYRPISLQTDHVSQASGIAETTFSAQVLTDGTVKFQGNSASAITANTQYYFTLTYIVAN